jgi:hypothetical protein
MTFVDIEFHQRNFFPVFWHLTGDSMTIPSINLWVVSQACLPSISWKALFGYYYLQLSLTSNINATKAAFQRREILRLLQKGCYVTLTSYKYHFSKVNISIAIRGVVETKKGIKLTANFPLSPSRLVSRPVNSF